MRSPRADLFWRMNGLPWWEQVAFAAANLPFSLITMLLGVLLFIPFQLMITLVLPFMLFTLLGSVIWTVCLAVILALSWMTERHPVFAPHFFYFGSSVHDPWAQPQRPDARAKHWGHGSEDREMGFNRGISIDVVFDPFRYLKPVPLSRR